MKFALCMALHQTRGANCNLLRNLRSAGAVDLVKLPFSGSMTLDAPPPVGGRRLFGREYKGRAARRASCSFV